MGRRSLGTRGAKLPIHFKVEVQPTSFKNITKFQTPKFSLEEKTRMKRSATNNATQALSSMRRYKSALSQHLPLFALASFWRPDLSPHILERAAHYLNTNVSH